MMECSTTASQQILLKIILMELKINIMEYLSLINAIIFLFDIGNNETINWGNDENDLQLHSNCSPKRNKTGFFPRELPEIDWSKR